MIFLKFETIIEMISMMILFVFQLFISILGNYYDYDKGLLLNLAILVIPLVYFFHILILKDYLSFKFDKFNKFMNLQKSSYQLETSNLKHRNNFLLNKINSNDKLDYYNTFYKK